jgi:anti-anti-sigma factor
MPSGHGDRPVAEGEGSRAPGPGFLSVFITGCVLQLIDRVSRASEMNTINDERILAAPSRLVAETRAQFRNAAVSMIESMSREAKVITLDLAVTREMDATGLGTLVAIQNCAKQFGMTVKLTNVTEEVLALLALTELLHLFVVESV